jgi:VIT1/CCC1 family predicted Fe2+/Mn2+ transporter
MLVGVVALALASAGGCVTAAQHEAAKEKVALRAGEEAQKAAYEQALKRGVADAEARQLGIEAGKLAVEAARVAYDKARETAGTGGLGQILTTLMYGLIQFGLPLLGKGVPA